MKKNTTEKICRQCKQPITVKSRFVYCSEECAKTGHNEYVKKYLKDNSEDFNRYRSQARLEKINNVFKHPKFR